MHPRGRRRTQYAYYLKSVWTLLSGIHDPLGTLRIFSPLPTPTVTTVRLRRHAATFRVRGASDVWSVKETWLDRFYERHGYAIEPGWRVVDVGAGIGEFTLLAAMSGARVVAFEPSPTSFATLRENLGLAGMADVVALDIAIGDSEGSTILDITGDPLRHGPTHDPAAGIQVRALSLAGALREGGLDRVDLLKMDCEGAEYDILRGAEPDTLARIDRIVMEYHDLDEQRIHGELVKALEGAGFQVETFANPVHTWTGYLRARRTPLPRSTELP